jgi:subtilase family serine protease
VLLWLPVGNSGLADAASFTVRFLDDEGATVTEESVTVLPSTESTVLGAIALSSDQWGPRLSVQVDADEDIEECDETNNEIDLGGWPCE